MAVENIIVNISAKSNLQPTIDQLVKMGVVSAKDAAEFKKLSDQTNKTTESLKKLGTEGSKGVQNVSTSAGTLKKTFTDLLPTITAALAVQTLIRFGTQSVQSFREAELSAKKLQTAIIDIGGEGEKAFTKLIEQSNKLQKISVFSDEDIQRSQTQLSQFGLLSNEIEGIIPKILDLASAQGIDLGQATDIVIQGINGVTRGLKPLGLEFQNTGSKAENFAIISEKLNKFQGQTAAILDTSAGRAANLGNQFDELKERIGGLIESTGILRGLSEAFATFIDSFKSIEELRQEGISELVQQQITAIQTEITAAISAGKTFEEAIIRQQARITNDFKLRSAERIKAGEAENTAELNRITGLENSLKLEQQALDIIKDQNKEKEKKSNLGLTEEEQAKRAAKSLEEATKKAAAALEEEKKALAEIGKGMQSIAIDLEDMNKGQTLGIKLITEFAEAAAKGAPAVRDFKNKISELRAEFAALPETLEGRDFKVPEIDFKKQEEELREFLDLSFQLADSLSNFISDVVSGANQASIDALIEQRDIRLKAFDDELASLQELNQNKILSDGAYTQKTKELAKQREQAEIAANKKIGEEKRKAFIAQRIASLAQAAINIAEGITKALAQTGVLSPFVIPALAALGALQIATILAQPIPKFKHGVLALQGKGTETSDSIPAMLSRNESVMTAGETKRFMPTLTAIRKNLISPELLNNFVINGQFGKVEAFVDTHKLSKNSRRQIPYQADMIGRSVAKHLSDYDYYSPLRQ